MVMLSPILLQIPSIFQFIAAFLMKFYLDFIWHPKKNGLSYDWLISFFVSGILISRPNLLDQIHFNFNIVNVVVISIITTLLIVLPIAIKK